MRITLDHNVIIDFVKSSPRVDGLRAAIVAGKFTPYVTEKGASEMRQIGVRPDRYDLFESLLREAGLESAERLTPLATFDFPFGTTACGAMKVSTQRRTASRPCFLADPNHYPCQLISRTPPAQPG